MIYAVAFIYFDAFWTYPFEGSPLEKMVYLAENQFAFSVIYFLLYAVFGIFLAFLVIGLYEQIRPANDAFAEAASVFGIARVALVIASVMLAHVGLPHAIDLMDLSPEDAFEMWRLISVLIESLGGGNELVGGLWMLLISPAALKAKVFPQWLNYLGLIVGISGIATIYPDDVLTEIFGITQII